jgi:hypothetical protein
MRSPLSEFVELRMWQVRSRIMSAAIGSRADPSRLSTHAYCCFASVNLKKERRTLEVLVRPSTAVSEGVFSFPPFIQIQREAAKAPQGSLIS